MYQDLLIGLERIAPFGSLQVLYQLWRYRYLNEFSHKTNCISSYYLPEWCCFCQSE